MKFTPFSGYVEVEPIQSDSSLLANEEKKFIEAATVISDFVSEFNDKSNLKIGDIIFFRPHGFFETPEYEGKKHYVVRVHEDFILGVLHVEK